MFDLHLPSHHTFFSKPRVPHLKCFDKPKSIIFNSASAGPGLSNNKFSSFKSLSLSCAGKHESCTDNIPVHDLFYEYHFKAKGL